MKLRLLGFAACGTYGGFLIAAAEATYRIGGSVPLVLTSLGVLSVMALAGIVSRSAR